MYGYYHVFLCRTLNLVRSVNRDLGGTTARRLLIFFRSAVVGALTPSLPEDSGMSYQFYIETHRWHSDLPI